MLEFVGLAWIASEQGKSAGLRTRLRRHPIAIAAHFEECLTLTYALHPDAVRPLLRPGLELDTYRGSAFVAVALVQTRALRPAGVPSVFGQDFFLAGYRVFVKFRTPDGRSLRGLQILRSDANRRRMVIGGNLLTHYNYHGCEAVLDRRQGQIHATVGTPDHIGNIDLIADLSHPSLPADSPFLSWRDARYFAGPMPYTFDYERETHSIIAIKAARTNWKPMPVGIDVRQMSFFDQPAFRYSRPILAAAFHVGAVDYRWERGVRYALDRATLEIQP